MAKTLATRMAFGQEIIEIAKTNENFVVCNADTKTCGLEKFGKYFPEREFSFGIAEQNLVAASARERCASCPSHPQDGQRALPAQSLPFGGKVPRRMPRRMRGLPSPVPVAAVGSVRDVPPCAGTGRTRIPQAALRPPASIFLPQGTFFPFRRLTE